MDTPAGSGGGIDTYVRQVARGLTRAGHDVHVIAPSSRPTRTFRMGCTTVHAIRSVPAAREGRVPQTVSALSFSWHAWRKLRALQQASGSFDIVETGEYKAPGFFAVRDVAVRLVVKCHAHLLMCLDDDRVTLTPDLALIAALERDVLRRARAINSNSSALADRCASDYGLDRARFAVVPYGIDTSMFRTCQAPPLRQLGLETSRLVLFVGRMEERKGISTLVEAFATVADRCPEAVLLLAGPDAVAPPANASNIEWMCRRWETLGIDSDRYRFLGPVPHHELPAWYSAATLLVAPSPFEAFGLIYTEAMACECPPIGCSTGGAPEVVVDGETGLLVPPGDSAALAEAMLVLMQVSGRRDEFARAGRRRVEALFTVDAMVERTVRFYREVKG